jgi:DNA-binding response OmpR family regulator
MLETIGYRVLLAQNGDEGVRLFVANSPSIVILDYLMPEMHGGLVAAEMRRLNHKIPIIFLSGCISIPEPDLALADAFVPKGQSPSVLISIIERLLLPMTIEG